jgi:Phage late control gene D protein (GPD).
MENIEVIIQHSETKNGKPISLNLTQVVNSIAVTTYLEIKPGKLELELKPLDSLEWVALGALITVKVDNEKLFFGYVFKFEVNQDRSCTITAYDQIRYLACKDTLVTKNATASDIFKQICDSYGIKYKLVAKSPHILAKRINDNKTYADMIAYALDKTLIDTNNWYFIRDNWGTVEFLDIYGERTNIAIGDASLLSQFSYTTSIDSDTYNQIKLVKENKETKRREIYLQKDSTNINRWGTLQFYEVVQDSMNGAQIKARADTLLKYYNKPKQTFKLGKCVGNFKIKAGRSFVVLIKDLNTVVPYNQYVICSSCTHKITNGVHTMELEVLI